MSKGWVFADRKADLAFLEQRWAGDGLEMIVVTGRRRVGKTTLLKEFMQGKPHVYHLVNQEEGTLQLRRLRDALVEGLGDVKPEINDWHDLFTYLQDALPPDRRFLIIVDEFPYLAEEEESIPSYFQALVDEYLAGTQAFLCLSGSSIGMMEEQVLSRKSPLYGRRTGRIDLAPFTLSQAWELFPTHTLERLMETYAIFGGTPHYLQFLGADQRLDHAIEHLVCDPRGPLHDEPELLLRQEFRRPHRYVSIVQAVAAGRTTPKAIADHTGIDPQSVPKYLGELERVRLLERRLPVTEETRRSRRGLYTLGDPFFRFWFRFVAPHLSHTEEDPHALVQRTILPELPAHTGTVFEDVCRQLTPKLFDGYGRVGGWWHQEHEIDILALDEQGDRMLVAECKWQENVDARRIVDDLQETASQIRWRAGAGREETYTVFARSFHARSPEATCLDLDELADRLGPPGA